MKIRVRHYNSGRVGYQLDFGVVGGRRQQKAYDSLKAAEKAMAEALRLQRQHGEAGHRLTPGDVAEFILARERLGAVSLITAVEYYLANARVVREPLEMPELVRRFVDAKERQGRGGRYLGQLPVSLGSFARSVETRLAHEVERADVEAWLHGNAWAPKTRNNYLGTVKTMFEWAVKMKHASKNPCEEVERAGLPDGEIEVLSVAEAEALLRKALEPPHLPLLGFVVIGLFCGIRPEEQQRMTWDAVDLVAGTVIVAGAKAKTRKRRVVDVAGNAREWLAVADAGRRKAEGGRRKAEDGGGQGDGGKICPRNFVDRWRALRDACGWSARGGKDARPWPHDGMRHTFASMHYAMHQNESLLQTQMGHESKDELHRHYRAQVSRAEAERFWALRPEKAMGNGEWGMGNGGVEQTGGLTFGVGCDGVWA